MQSSSLLFPSAMKGTLKALQRYVRSLTTAG